MTHYKTIAESRSFKLVPMLLRGNGRDHRQGGEF